MTRGPHDASREQWELLDGVLSKLHRAFESSDAKTVLRICLEVFAESDKLNASGQELLDILLEYVGPGRKISVDSEGLATVLAHGIGNGIPTEDGKCQEFRVGDTWYRFKAEYGVPLEGRQESDGTWGFGVADETSSFLGHGQSREAAANDWRYRVHTRFQQLVRSRPFRMSEEEKADWAILSELIDVERYWRNTPIKQQETGWISSILSGICEITWLGSETTETVSLEHVPPEFASFGEGQWFEALVERKRDNYTLNKVIHARPIDPIKEMTDEEMKEWFSSLPTTETLPKSDTDWNTF